MFNKLLREEIVSLKRQDFKDNFYLKRLDSLKNKGLTFKRWVNTGQLISVKEYFQFYGSVEIPSNTLGVFRYAGGLSIFMLSNSDFWSNNLEKQSTDLPSLERDLYKYLKSKTNEVRDV